MNGIPLIERDKSRFYNYPPVLPEINGKEIFSSSFDEPEISLYVHIPFCERICFFCPYNKYIGKGKPVDEYINALKKEISLVSGKIENSVVSSVFFGGGTPTYLSGEQLSGIFSFLKQKFVFSDACQSTVEANPFSSGTEKLSVLFDSGFNRISFGVQSFDDAMLKRIGTNHDSVQAVNAINNASNAGFENINIDLMYRLPGQSIGDWRSDLEKATELPVNHVTTYALDIVPGTAMYSMNNSGLLPLIPSFEEEKEMLLAADEILGKKGMQRYLIDQFALRGKENIYAINTLSGNVLGFGCGAFSHLNSFEFMNTPAINDFIQKINSGDFAASKGKKLSLREQMERFMVKSVLFLSVNKNEFRKKFGKEINAVFGKEIGFLEKAGFLLDEGEFIAVTVLGQLYIYNVCREFYSGKYRQIIKVFEASKNQKTKTPKA